MATGQAEGLGAVDHPASSEPTPGQYGAVGAFAGLSVVGGHSHVRVRLAGRPDAEVTLGAIPDARLARTLTAGFRRLAWVRIDASGPITRCEVSGMTRRAHRCRLPLPAALALAEADVPTLVRLRPMGT
ncbi:MAG: hypothetical protein KY438_08090 [Actinobacteria bacterium]|nr:hypothetical protein [Actinomycetota bacterium]